MAKKMFTLLKEGSTTPVFNIVDDGTVNSTNFNITAIGAVQFPQSIVNATAATLAVTADSHAGRTIVLDRAAGIAVTLPTPTGSGNIYKFIIKTTVTSNSTTIKVPSAAETIRGIAVSSADDAASTAIAWATASTTDTITLDGTTTGGTIGDYIELVDISATQFMIANMTTVSTGTEATPFSATVS